MPVYSIDAQTIDVTEAAIRSLKDSADCRLILIDNASTVGGGRLRELADVYIRNKENLGYAKAVNQGLQLSGMAVAIANNDIRVSPNWYTVTQEVMDNPKVASLHFRMIPYDEPFAYGDKTFTTGRERWCTGSFFVIRNIQLFDEDFLNSYDDWDFQYRLRKNGWLTAYTTKACYQHMDSFTQKKIPQREDNNWKNRELFKQKHGEYPENIWCDLYPDQMQMDWRAQFNEL